MKKNDCESFFDAGHSYLQTAQHWHRGQSVCRGAMIYHILCLSIEKFLMGIFCYHHAVPQHNTLFHMVQEVAAFTDIPEDLIEQVQSMDNVLNSCDSNTPLQASLTESRLAAMLTVGERVRRLVAAHLPHAA